MKRKSEKLAQEEKSLKEKYQKLRELKTKEPEVRAVDNAKAKLEEAKKIIAKKAQDDAAQKGKETGFKRPALRKSASLAKGDDAQPNQVASQGFSAEPERKQSQETYWGESEQHSPQEPEPSEPELFPDTIYIGDLGDFIDQAELEYAFARFGPIDSIKIFPGKNYAFIKYQASASAEVAIKSMNGEVISGSRIRCAFARVPRKNKGNYTSPDEYPEQPFSPEKQVQYPHQSPERPTKQNTSPERSNDDERSDGRGVTNYDDL